METTRGEGTPKTIQYPMAYVKPYGPVHIDEAKPRDLYFCLGCDQQMITRKGDIRRHHFAHKPPFTYCDSNNALHETAKANICRGFIQASESGEKYELSFPCQACGNPIKADITELGACIASERSVVPGTRSDLVVMKQNGVDPRVIIEIVVHHDLEPGTKQKYENSRIPVVKIGPTWETVSELLRDARGYQALNITEPRCQECTAREKKRKETEAKRKAKADQLLLEKKNEAAQMLSGMKLRNPTRSSLAAITHDRYGARLRAETKLQIAVNARRLAKLGFQQQSSRPTLFLFGIGQRKVYADLDSTEVMRIWEVGCAPALYSFPAEGGPGCRECILEEVERIFDQNAIPYRRHFEDFIGHDHEEETEDFLEDYHLIDEHRWTPYEPPEDE